MQRISISIPLYLLEQIKKRAETCGVSISRWVCDILAKEMEKNPAPGEPEEQKEG
jgi:metal-responsive CopG/Arc/MetJ family transcriptional regulator